MKKVLTVLVALFAFAALASAQPRAIGVRAGWGGTISYQHTLGGENFLEADLGWTAGSINIAANYDFHICPVGPLNFYAGPGVSVFVWNGGVGVGVNGQLGLEYTFDKIPLQLSLDWRPIFLFVPATAFGWYDFGLGIRYAF